MMLSDLVDWTRRIREEFPDIRVAIVPDGVMIASTANMMNMQEVIPAEKLATGFIPEQTLNATVDRVRDKLAEAVRKE